MQAYAGDENRGHRHQGNHDAGRVERRANDRTLVLVEQLGNAVERDRIDVPGVAGNVGDLVDGAVVRRMESVVHAGRQPQRNVLAIVIELDELRVDQQILQCVGKSLGLDQLVPVDPSAGADNGITGARYNMRVAVDRMRAGFQLPREASVQAREALRPRFAQVEIGEPPPDRDRGSRQQRRLNLAEPADKPIRQLSRDALLSRKPMSSRSTVLADAARTVISL